MRKTYTLPEENITICLDCLDRYLAQQGILWAYAMKPRSCIESLRARISKIKDQLGTNTLRRSSVTFIRKVLRNRINDLTVLESYLPDGGKRKSKIELLRGIVARIEDVITRK